MASDRTALLEDRLRQVERRIDLIDYRLHSLELRRTGEQVPTPPPVPGPTYKEPVYQQPAEPKVETPVTLPPVQPVVPPPVIRQPLPVLQERLNQVQAPKPVELPKSDTEYMIGSKLLPKLGAGLVLLAILYFVGLGYSSGWITPLMVFTGEILFCLAFIGVGQWKRNEREQYGQILTGIGSCGLYLSVAGGHLVQNLFSGNAMVIAFMALSFANLFYGLASKSKAFLAIGIIGGLAAALMPLKEHKTILNAILTLAIVAPAAIIAARRKWADMSVILWIASVGALVPLMTSSVDWPIRVAVLYFASLASISAYLHSAKENSFDPEFMLGPVLLFATGLIGFAIEHNRIGSVHLLALAAGSALVSFATQSTGRSRSQFAAAAIALTIAPFCFSAVECLWILVSLSLVAAAATITTRSPVASVLAGIEFVLAVSTYTFIQSWHPILRGPEGWILIGLIVAGIGTATSAIKSGGGAEAFTMGAMAITLPLFCRLGVVAITGTSFSGSVELSAAQALALFALAAVAITARTKWFSAMVAMWLSFSIAAIAYMYAVAFEVVPGVQDATLLLILAATSIVGLPVALGTSPIDFKKSISGATGILVGLISMRLAYVLATMPHAHVVAIDAVALTAAAYVVGASAWAIWRKSEPAVAVTWAMLVACAGTYGQAIEIGVPRIAEMWIIGGLLAGITAASLAIEPMRARLAEVASFISAASGIVAGLLVMRLGYVYSAGGHDYVAWTALAGAGYSLSASTFASFRKSVAAVIVSWSMFAAAGLAYITGPTEMLRLSIEMQIISGLLLAFIAASAATSGLSGKNHQIWHGIALLGWIMFSRWVDVAMTWSGTNLHGASTLTVAWIVYALALICLGFGLKVKELRLWSFAVMFTTVSKILLIDLANTSIPFRVGVLLGLGLLMLGGGYWYIRGKNEADRKVAI